MTAEEEEIFEIQDFTVTTEWEKFTARLETLIHEWQLTGKSTDLGVIEKGSLRGNWKVEQEPVRLSGVHFKLFHYKLEGLLRKPRQMEQQTPTNHIPGLVNDMLSPGNEFPPFYDGPAQLARWFGIPEFLFLSPASRTDIIYNDSKLNLIMSSLSMATLATACEIPFFTSYDDLGRHLYFGISQNHNVRTRFSTIQLNNSPCTNLAGVLDLFKEKVASPVSAVPPVKVSVRLVYRLSEKLDSDHMIFPNIEDFDTPPRISGIAPTEFPFGVGSDPLKSLDLCVVWPSMNEDMVVENDVYTDLDPNGAPQWSIAVAFMGGLECLLHDSLKKFLEHSRYHSVVNSELGIAEDEPAVGSALGRLTKAPVQNILPSSGSTSDFRRTKEPKILPLDQNTIDSLLEFVFGIASYSDQKVFNMKPSPSICSMEGNSAGSVPGKVVSAVTSRKSSVDGDEEAEMDSFKQLLATLKEKINEAKAAPPDSVASKLSLALRLVNDSAQNKAGLCHLWYEFVQRLRSYWDTGTLIPGIDGEDEPDLSSCILHQKLAMLQSCLVAKQKRENARKVPEYSEDDSDEFYDCMEEESEAQLIPSEPEGRSEPLGIFYLDDPTKPLYKPETQESGPMTEDMLAEEVSRMMELGSSQEGAEIRAKMQSQSLISDIQAFKAANPGARFEDFVRWHSPRDWIENPAKGTGSLSPRMSFAENLWVQLWKESGALPVFRQKRLFDYAKCGEKILKWLESSTVSGVVMLTLPPLFSLALARLYDESAEVWGMIEGKLLSSATKHVSATRLNQADNYRDILNDVAWVENTVAQFRGLKTRFLREYQAEGGGRKGEKEELNLLITAAMLQEEVPLVGAGAGLMGRMIRNIFKNNMEKEEEGRSEKRPFPPPRGKEYILKWKVPRPLPYSRPTPHRVYAAVGPGKEFRVAGAFSEDALFF